MALVKRIAIVSRACVACGCCVKACPVGAIAVHKGLRAVVNGHTCVGCGKCVKTCPADVIMVREADTLEKALV